MNFAVDTERPLAMSGKAKAIDTGLGYIG